MVTGDLVLDSGETGSLDKDIEFTFFSTTGAFEPSVDGIPMPREFTGLGTDGMAKPAAILFIWNQPVMQPSRNTMELTMTNTTGAHHPFHLHGFSVQPIKLTPRTGTTGPSYSFPYNEFRDIVDVPGYYYPHVPGLLGRSARLIGQV